VAEGGLKRSVVAAAVTTAAAVAAEVAAPAGSTALAVLDALVAVAFAFGGAAVLRVSRAVGAMAFAVAVAGVLGTLAGLDGVPSYVAGVAVVLHRAPLAWLLLAYPGRRLRPVLPLAVAALLVPFVPEDGGPWATSATVGLAALVASARALRAPAALRPPLAAAATAGLAVAVTGGLAAAAVGSATELLVVYEAVMLATAAGLLAPLAAGRWGLAAASGLVVELGAAAAGAPVTARLASILNDPGLELRLRFAGGAWTDELGRPAPEPAEHDGQRSVTHRLLDDGTEVALVHDPVAIPDRAVAESAVAVAATAIDNARRDRDVRTRIEELRRLRRGLVGAADEERRQLEVELRSGALRGVDELDAILRDLPADAGRPLRHELALARKELLDVARGLYPRILAERGLAGAVEDLATRAPIPVACNAGTPGARLRPDIALTAYYVAGEALANIAKHARARQAVIEITVAAGELLVRVSDDGIGDADPAGAGIAGLRARVQAVDGRLEVHSPAGAGTVVEARMPTDDA
jgi:hypothetical protein